MKIIEAGHDPGLEQAASPPRRKTRASPIGTTLLAGEVQEGLHRLGIVHAPTMPETVERVGPRLVVLDPLVRLHGVDESTVDEIAPILGFPRDLQRRFETAVPPVPHVRKSGAERPGEALRGSSELHARGDSCRKGFAPPEGRRLPRRTGKSALARIRHHGQHAG
ncbi:MAG: hypothetical protein OXI22_01260 [Defluviicoccus sp.]|nr:hypothetical protein [Defluviicoccus sp.]MDE0382488.1 hypothetical protein [Defluviicoccus sp.]